MARTGNDHGQYRSILSQDREPWGRSRNKDPDDRFTSLDFADTLFELGTTLAGICGVFLIITVVVRLFY